MIDRRFEPVAGLRIGVFETDLCGVAKDDRTDAGAGGVGSLRPELGD